MDELINEELDQEMEALEQVPEPLPELFSEPIEEYEDAYRKLSENLLALSNKYAKAKEETDLLKAQRDKAEYDLTSFYTRHKDVCPDSVTYTGLGTFKQREEVYGDVAQADIDNIFNFFKDQKREDEFFKLAAIKTSFNKFVREKQAEFNEAQQKVEQISSQVRQLIKDNADGKHTELINQLSNHQKELESELVLDIPAGIRYFKKQSISITNRNRAFGL